MNRLKGCENMIYVQFGTEDDRFMRKLTSMQDKHSIEYTELINTPQLKQMDFHVYHCDKTLEITEEFLLLALLELDRHQGSHHLSVSYNGFTYELDEEL